MSIEGVRESEKLVKYYLMKKIKLRIVGSSGCRYVIGVSTLEEVSYKFGK